MANCSMCGEALGFFKSILGTKICGRCKSKIADCKSKIVNLVGGAASRGGNLADLESMVDSAASAGGLDKSQVRELLVKGWEEGVAQSLDDRILSESEEQTLLNVADHFGLSASELDRNGAHSSMVKNLVVRDVLNDIIPDRVHFEGAMSFNLQKTEKMVWVWDSVDYLEDRTRTRYVGGSQGMSVRIAKGVWWRANAFRGERIQEQETVYVDTGTLAVTDRHMYFHSSMKSFRIHFGKIVSFRPFENGIGVHRDAMTAKPQLFVLDDANFAYNLITNLARM